MKENQARYVPELVCTSFILHFLAHLVSTCLVVVHLCLHMSVAEIFWRQMGNRIHVIRNSKKWKLACESQCEAFSKSLVPDPWCFEAVALLDIEPMLLQSEHC